MTALTEAAGRYRAVAALLEEHPPLIGADEKGHNAAAVRRGHRGRDLCPGCRP